jgi:hypothetical protein
MVGGNALQRKERVSGRKSRHGIGTTILDKPTSRVIKNLALRAFANAAWHCPTAAAVARVFNEAHSTETTDEDDAKWIEAIIGAAVPAYGEIIEKWPLVIFPVSRLPLSGDENRLEAGMENSKGA